jgi:hypothetical protein
VDDNIVDANAKTIEGYFTKGFIPNSGGGPGENPWVGVWTVYLLD